MDTKATTEDYARLSIGALLWQFRHPCYWSIWLLMLLARLISLLPLPVIYGLSCALGEVAFYLFAYRRRIVLRNLSACFPQNSRCQTRHMARRYFRFMVYGLLTVGIGWWASKRRLARLGKIVNEDILRLAMARQRNIILLAPHFVGLEFGAMFLASRLIMVAVHKKSKNALLAALILKYRTRFGGDLYEHSRGFKGLVRTIRSGRPCYYLPDQNIGRKGVFANFFDIPTATNPFLGRLATMSDASILPVCTRALPWGRGFEIVFFPPLDDQLTGNPVGDAECLNRTVEQLVRIAPAQYIWSHRKFKTRLPGEPPFYD